MDPSSSLTERQAFFEPYARLIQVLYPRTRGIAFYDAEGNSVWRNDPDLDASLASQVRALLQDAGDPEKSEQIGSERLLSETIPAYVFWLRDGRASTLGNQPLGMIGITCKPATESLPAPTVEDLAGTLRPVLQCAARELSTLRRLPSAEQKGLATRRLQAEWLIDKALPLMSAETHAEPLPEIIRCLVEYTDAALGALVIPERSLRIFAEHGGWDPEKTREVFERTLRRVHTRTQVERRPLIVNQLRGTSDTERYRLLAAPILQRADLALGYVALLKPHFGAKFGRADQQLLERLGPLLNTLVERDYDSVTALRCAAGLERAAQRLLRSGSTASAAAIFIDIIELSRINAESGPPAADRIIRRVARLLCPPTVPEKALCARLSGGHFACLLPGCSVQEAQDIAARIQQATNRIDRAGAASRPAVRLRTGVAEVNPTATGWRYALVAARAAAAAGAKAGTSASVDASVAGVDVTDGVGAASVAAAAHADTGADADAVGAQAPAARQAHGNARTWQVRRAGITPMRLRDALRDQQLRLFAQPIQPLRDSRRPLRIELLPRIQDERGQLIEPLEFLAEGPDPETLTALDRWVMTAALNTLLINSANLAAGVAEFSINVSSSSLEIAAFHEWVAEQLHRDILPASRWLFEISEMTALRQRQDVEKFAHQVLRAGGRIVLDDVGANDAGSKRQHAYGASSIKMDGSLVREIATDARARRLMEALAKWAGSIRMDTVAKHVENEQQQEQLQRLGIDYAQGFAICRPQPLERILSELKLHSALNRKWGT
jgi:EAL domain-containing protein (putative c-di-GMP-specific phosphodiesterase class I)/GGDEF domain-containing protein